MRELAEAEIGRWPLGEELVLQPRMRAITLEVILRTVFGAEGEMLSIAHFSNSRSSFMPGVLLAVRAASGLTRFVDGLGELL